LSERIGVVALIDRIERIGGGEAMAVEIARRLDADRFRSALCVTRWSGREAEEEPGRSVLESLEASGVEVLGLDRRSKLDLAAWAPLRKRLADGTSVVHAHMFGSNVWGSLLGTLARVPAVVAHEHMWSFSGDRARTLIDRNLIGRLCDAFVAVSQNAADSMIGVEGIPADKVRVIPNGIPPVQGADGARFRRDAGIAPDAPLVGSVGMLRPEKAFEVLIEAAAALRAERPDAVVVIAGEGEERAALEEAAERLGLGDAVRLLGYRSDTPDLVAALDVAVCCSDFEGTPLSVLQYMQAGVPVVATEVGGLPELIDDNVNGLLVPPRDAGALAAGIGELLADGALRKRLGEAAAARQRERYGIEETVRKIEGLYEELLARA
jgi:glycosyltransferase involved in cell wall biosynthesis